MTTACASANDAISEAFMKLNSVLHDVVLAGGAEASITKIGIGGFNALTALSTTKDQNVHQFDKDHNVVLLWVKVQGSRYRKLGTCPKTWC